MKRFFLLSALVVLAFSATNCNNNDRHDGTINARLADKDDRIAPFISDSGIKPPESGGEDETLPNIPGPILPPKLPAPPLAGITWKLAGIVDAGTGSLTELIPKDCWKCYTLTFGTDTVFSSFASVNTSHGTYKANYLTDDYLKVTTGKISFKIGMVTKAGGPYISEEEQYWGILGGVESYSLQESELKLYYDGNKKYLLFKPQPAKTLTGTRWKLIEGSIAINYRIPVVIDYSDKDIIYEFRENNKLIITGKTESLFVTDSIFVFDDFQKGEHFYEYKESQKDQTGVPVKNLLIDNPKSGQEGGRYYAQLGDNKLMIGSEWTHEYDKSSSTGEIISYGWSKYFAKLK